MRYLYCCVAIFLLLDCSTFGRRRKRIEVKPEPIVVNDIIGDIIDLEERDRYGLFYSIENFVSAQFYDRIEPDTSYEIVLITEHKQYVALNNDPLTLPMLRDYIEHYDSISVSRDGFEEKWQIVDYDTLGLPITQVEVDKQAIMSPGKKALFVSGCSIGGAGIGCLIGGLLGLAERDTDEQIGFSDTPDLSFVDDAKNGALIGAAIGAVAGIISLPTIVKSLRPKKILSDIKKMRKPKEMK